MLLGVISDTHGTVSREALKALKGTQYILHAGDVGGPEVLDKLASIAPVRAVRGNTDSGFWAQKMPKTEMVSILEKAIYILHDLSALDLDPAAAGIQIVISGHTHQAESKIVKGVVYFNPGSASVRRHGGPLTVGRIQVAEDCIQPVIIEISA